MPNIHQLRRKEGKTRWTLEAMEQAVQEVELQQAAVWFWVPKSGLSD